MPTYDYLCESNGRRLEVKHKMSVAVSNWGQLCELAGVEAGETPADAPVRKLIGAAAVVGGSAGAAAEPACSTGACCPGGFCGLN